MLGFWSIRAWTDVIAQRFSPSEMNPLNINPLRDAVDALIDFDRVRACTDVEIFISATNVWTGKVAIFKRQELTADHLLASACLPTVFQAVEIDGVPYWDGGYMGNPALFPLFHETMTDDILLVQIHPLERRQTPRTVSEVHNRLNEITFNGNLLRELRAVAFVKRLIEEGKLSPDEYKNHMHRIDASAELDDYEASSKRKAEWDFFVQLRDAGRWAAQSWLAAHYGAIGVCGTLDVQSAFHDAGHHPPAHAFTRSRSLADVAREPGRRAPRSAITRTADKACCGCAAFRWAAACRGHRLGIRPLVL